MLDQIMAEGNAVIGDLEVENMQHREDNETLIRRIAELETECEDKLKSIDFWVDSYQRECKRTEEAKAARGNVETLVRKYLDAADYEDDTPETRELRKILWNDSDTEKELKAELGDVDEESNTAAWNEMNVGA